MIVPLRTGSGPVHLLAGRPGRAPERRVSMTEVPPAGPLEAHLEEVCELFSALLPESRLGVAIYEGSGGRMHQVGLDGLPDRLPRSADLGEGPGVKVSIACAYARIRTAEAGDPAVFAVCSAAAMPASTLASLSRMGASFLRRTLALLKQTRSLQQFVREQEAIIDHISDGLIVLDSAGTLRYLNAPAARMLGLDPSSAIGRKFRTLVDFDPFIMDLFETGKGYVDRELHLRSRGGSLHILDTAVPILGDDGKVASIVNTFHEFARAKQLSNRLAGDRARYRFSDVIGQSRRIREAVAVAQRAARSDANVLLYGESGTGKEVFTQSIHNDSRRSAGPFVAVNCAALPRDLIESEMFGYSPGSFTGADKSGRMGRFELASGGTIFLDEISEMPLDMQAKLLRVLQEKQVTRIGATASTPVDIRVIAAANRDLRELVENKAFREDLYYRLNVMRIDLPPLRERREDIAALATESLKRACALLHRPTLVLSDRALRQLEAYPWPGNVRQLQNVIERLVNMTDADRVEDVPADWLRRERGEVRQDDPAPGGDELLTIEDAERRAVRAALEACAFNLTRTAAILGITRPTLYAKMRRFGLGPPPRRSHDRGH